MENGLELKLKTLRGTERRRLDPEESIPRAS